VIAGAALLKAVRAHERGLDRSARASFGAGAGAAFISALGSIRLLERDGPLWPYAAYRVALAAAIVRRLRGLTSARSPTMRL
jgi:undecaprenyl pyrophosphate phosphatase UppP